jgi:hypothetical protein
MSSFLEPLMEVNKVADISNKKALIKMKNFLTLNAINESSDTIQTSLIGAVSEELLEKIEKVTQAIETERSLCRPVPPVTLITATAEEEGETAAEVVAETPKKSKKKRDPSTASSTKEKKLKRAKTQ